MEFTIHPPHPTANQDEVILFGFFFSLLERVPGFDLEGKKLMGPQETMIFPEVPKLFIAT